MPLILRELPINLNGHSAREARHHCDVLDVIADCPGITRDEIAKKVGISPTRTQAYLTQFIKDGLLTRSKSGQKYFYYLTPLEAHGQ